MKSNFQEPVNLGNPDEFTILNFASLVKEKTKSKSEIVFEELPVDDPRQRCPDISRAKEVLNWEPKISIEEGLDKTIKWYRSII